MPTKVTTSEFDRFLEPLEEDILSSFLISRSNCAFVNFTSESSLEAAIHMWDGAQIRPGDPKCPFLVCRARNDEDEEKAGVRGQRNAGIHRGWVTQRQEHQDQQNLRDSDGQSQPSSSEALAPPPPFEPKAQPSEPPSQEQTHSSFLEKFFPVRYFVLKSSNRAGLQNSVRTGTWHTQAHNEQVLDRAFRTSQEVYLIFSENKSGTFFGYAKLKQSILGRISDGRDFAGGQREEPPGRPPEPQSYADDITPRRTNSPVPLTDPMPSTQDAFRPGPWRSAPPILGPSYFELSTSVPPLPGSPLSFISLPETQEEAELIVQTDEGELEFHEEFIGSLPPTSESTPRELASSQSDLGGLHKHRISMSRVSSSNSDDHLAPPTLSSRPASTGSGSGSDSQRAVVEFEIEWIKTLPLPFKRTRHIRNVWNDNREVKISRDGTELDPIAGQLLVEAWYEEEQLQHNSAGQAGRRNGRRGRRRRGSQTLQRTPA